MEIKFSHKIFIAAIGLIGTCIIIYLTTFNSVGLSPDSVYYISVARHIVDGKGFVGYDGYNYVLQPPLYPLVLAVLYSYKNIDPLFSAGYVNAFLFGILLFSSGRFLLKHLKSFPLVIMGTVFITVSLVLIILYLIALSEPLFILLVILFLYFFDDYRENKTLTSLLLFSTAASFACLTRYAGIILILTGCTGIVLWGRKTIGQTFRHLFIFVFISTLPTCGWILRNYLVSGTFTGSRAGSSYTLIENINYFFNTVIKWYLPVQFSVTVLVLFVLIFLGILSFVIYFLYGQGDLKLRVYMTSPLLLFVLFYALTIIISSTTTAYDKIADRLLSPIFVPTVFLIFIALDLILISFKRHSKSHSANLLFLTAVLIWMINPAMRTVNLVRYYIGQSGWEISSSHWKSSGVIGYLNNNNLLEKNYTYFSNAPDAVYILTGRQTKWSPAKTFYNSPQVIKPKSELNYLNLENNFNYLIWFNNVDRNFLFSVNELRKNWILTRVAKLKDGNIYKIAQK